MPLTHRSYPKRWTAYDVRALMEAAVPEYRVVDLSRRLVERWRPGDRHAEVLASTLVWDPPGPDEALTIDLPSLFAVVGESNR
jgi:hypothetical protein